MHFRASLPLAALLVLPLACVDAPPERSAEAKPEQPATEPAPAPVEAKAPSGSLELSAEELELIDADPRALSPEQNRKRAYALRKKVLQNPDSPQAQALEEARAAALGGELTPEQVNPDGSPDGGSANKDSGLVIELPEHLKK
ncbi:MAG TPA: hypothetical protein VK034_30640 [Enhygromyxa sp.]|nr:hypothetical protein [Enhygromyxa sp.]